MRLKIEPSQVLEPKKVATITFKTKEFTKAMVRGVGAFTGTEGERDDPSFYGFACAVFLPGRGCHHALSWIC